MPYMPNLSPSCSLSRIFADPKPYVLETVNTLPDMALKIGSTTGYTDSMMNIVVSKATELGYTPDCWFSPDAVNGKCRPYPYMIFENLKALQVTDVKHVLKVGDTVSDIKEGVNAGVWSVGVIEDSSELGLSQEEFESLPPAEQDTICQKAETIFRTAGAHFVIRNFSALPQLICALDI